MSSTPEPRDQLTPAPQEAGALLAGVVDVATAAGQRLLALFSSTSRPGDREAMVAAARANEEAAGAGLQEALQQLRPQARRLAEEQETTALPEGEWWVVDTVEGNVNHVHGLPRWCVSITLVRDGDPVLTVVRQPVGDLTYTAVRGGGAHLNGQVLSASAKQGLDVAVVETGQAEAGQRETYARIGASITAMLGSALAVRAQVPSTFPMLSVAAGHTDAFWQYAPTLPGVAAGILLVTEAGGTATTIDGATWAPGADTVLVAGSGVHAAVRNVLASVS